MEKRNSKAYFLLIALVLVSISCTKKTYTSDVFIRKQWQVSMSAAFTVPANPGRTDHAVATLYVTSDNQLYYDVYFDANLNTGDTPTSVKLYNGAAAENGTLLLDLHNGTFTNREVKGNLPLDDATATKLLAAGNNVIYMQVNSAMVTTGLVRGQIDKAITAAYDIDLAKYSSTVNTTATGKAYIRVLADNSVSYQVVVNNLPTNDTLTLSHIHKTSDNSTVLVLAASAADFNKVMGTTVTAALAASLNTDNLYVDAHSTQYPSGLLKGTIR